MPDLEEKIKELESKLTTLEASLALKDKEFETLKAEIKKLQDENQTLTDENQRLDKELTITKANAQDEKEQIEVEKIVTDALSAATVSEAFHDKIKSQFKDRKTGKYSVGAYRDAEGNFDRIAFETAFKAEINDWEGKISSTGMGVGVGKPKDDSENLETGTYASENTELLAPYKKKIE